MVKKSTRVNHPPVVEVPADNQPVVAPIHQSVKFEFQTLDDTLRSLRGERAGFFYLRSSNPTTRQLELTLAELQGRDDCLVCASGVGAIAQALLSLTRQGDHVLCFFETYGPTRHLIRRTLAKFGVEHTLLSIADLAGIERVLSSRPTRLVVFESPTNPINRIADIATITRLARAHGALTVLDNTFAGVHQHGQYDIDIFLHSLTKFVSGHGDVMGGAAIANASLIRGLRPDFTVLGGALDPHAAFLLQRGLKTYFVRFRAQCAGRTDERLRCGRELRSAWRCRGRTSFRRSPAAVCDDRKCGLDGVTRDAAADARQPRFERRAAARGRHHGWHGSIVDRPGGRRRPA